MLHKIIAWLAGIVTAVIVALGYPGVILFMALESACIPIPSEIIMPYAGFLVSQGKMSLWGAAFAGAFGCMLGSMVAYWAGIKGGRPLVEKYGRYIFISQHDLDLADRWFGRWGQPMVFLARLLPVIRTFISFPAGIERMNFPLFTLLSFAGSLPWCYFLAWIGMKAGDHWDTMLGPWFHRFDFAIVGLGILAAIWWIQRHRKHAVKTAK